MMHRYCVLLGGHLEHECDTLEEARRWAEGAIEAMRREAGNSGLWDHDDDIQVCQVIEGYELRPTQGDAEDYEDFARVL